MLHPALHLLATRPQWLAEHAEAYAELAAAEVGEAAKAWQRSALLGAVSLLATTLAAGLGGVALMLWAALPELPARTQWLLWATPALPLVLAVVGALAFKASQRQTSFTVLREQLQADLALLRAVGAST